MFRWLFGFIKQKYVGGIVNESNDTIRVLEYQILSHISVMKWDNANGSMCEFPT